MVASCPSDGSVTWLSGDCGFDFTVALEDYILIIIPAASLLLLAPLRLRTLWSRTIKVVSPTILQLIKTLTALIFVACSFAYLVATCIRPEIARSAEITATTIVFLASISALLLSHSEHFRSVRPSKLLQLHLVVALAIQIVHLRTIWTRHDDIVLQGLGIGQVIACAAFLATESLGKTRILLTDQIRSPQDVNDLFSDRFFWWLNSLFTRGYQSILAPEDLGQTDKKLSSPDTDRRFRLTWLKEYNRNPKVSLIRIIFLALRYDILFPIIPRLLLLSVNFAQPYLILRFVRYLENPAEGGTEEGIFLVLATALVYTAIATFQSWYWQSVARFLVKLRACLTIALHGKALRCRPDAGLSPLTLMNVDVERVLIGLKSTHEYWSTTLSIGIALGLLYGQMGIVFLAPLVLLVILISTSIIHGTRIGPKQTVRFAATQERISYIAHVIASMKNIKLLGIVPSVTRRGTQLREKEINAQRSIRAALLLNLVIALSNSQLAALVLYGTFAISTRLGGPALTNTRLFTSLSILNLFTAHLMRTIQTIPSTMQAMNRLGRIQDYLASEDHIDDRHFANDEANTNLQHPKNQSCIADDQYIVRFTDVTCGYRSGAPVLENVTCNFKRGSTTMIVGPIGSGKSTLLKALLGETNIIGGSVAVTIEDIALCDQNPWLWNASIKENICGMMPYEKVWFHRVIWACGLQEDFEQFKQGIYTSVGSDGTSLSGGQKSRISLARALYSRKSLAILDDVLSGLDTKTEKLVYARVFAPGGIFERSNTTVIFATHAIKWTRYATHLICLDQGKTTFQGLPGDASSPYSSTMNAIDPIASRIEYDDNGNHIVPNNCGSEQSQQASHAIDRGSDIGVYKKYIGSFGYMMTLCYFILSSLSIAGMTVQTLWLKWWAAAAPASPSQLGKYAGTLTAITVISVVVLTVFVAFFLLFVQPRSSNKLHAQQWTALMNVAYAVWGIKDAGNIANRFSQDIGIIDQQLGSMWIYFTTTGLKCLVSAAILVVATRYVAAVIPALLVIFWAIQKVYLRTSKQLRKMDLEAKAPLCTHFMETTSGVVTIKSYGWSQACREKNAELLRRSQTPFYLLESVQNWLSLVLGLVVAGLATVVMAIAVRLHNDVDAGFIGLAMIQIMELGEYLELMIKSWTGLEISLGAIARMSEFIDDMPPEEQGSIVPPLDWLSQGQIDIRELTASYADTTKPALKNINLCIKPGEKVAICGRTGGGKSSLASAIFGLLYIQEGSIEIDGVNVIQISQDLLRSKMVAIPQDAYFSPGTVRENLALTKLSAFEMFDTAMTEVLQKVGLLEKFTTLALSHGDTWLDALDVELNPSKMLTKGQMQLFAMARAMLSPGQIVFIDEATSGLDHASEALVQKLLRQEFAGRTIVAVAHHLQTITDFDIVIVMENGRIAEVGKPDELKNVEGSLFAQLLRAVDE